MHAHYMHMHMHMQHAHCMRTVCTLQVPDLFMRRVEQGGKWSFFCPNEAPGLCDVHGAAFDELYERYEREGRARESVDAQKVWFAILESQMETGAPAASNVPSLAAAHIDAATHRSDSPPPPPPPHPPTLAWGSPLGPRESPRRVYAEARLPVVLRCLPRVARVHYP